MKLSTKIELKRAEIRRKLNAAITKVNEATEPDEAAETEMRELTTELDGFEVRHADAIKAEAAALDAGGAAPETRSADPGETLEIRQIRGRVQIGRYMQAVANSRPLDGAEAEFNAALQLPDGRNFPMELLAPPVELRTKADAVNTQRARRWIDRLFAGSAAEHVGVTMESVEPGEQVYTVTKTGGTPAQRGREENAATGAWTLGTTTMSPSRMSIFYEYTREDALRLPGLEDALRRDMSMSLRERMDYVCLLGDSGANEGRADITGLNSVAGTTAKTITQAKKIKAPDTLAVFASLIDGIHAESAGDLRAAFSVPYSTLAMSTLPVTNRPETLGAILRENGVSWRTRASLDNGTADGDLLAVIGLGRGIVGAAVAAMWSAGELIVDQYSGAKAGKIGLALNAYWDFEVPRPSNFAKLTAAA